MIPKVTNDIIYFSRNSLDAIIPKRSRPDEDAGYDIWACFEEEYIIINAHETREISTKIHTAFSNNYVFILKERGSTGTIGIGQRSGVIDSGYRGEIFIPITNLNSTTLILGKEKSREEFLALKLNREVLLLDKNFIYYSTSKAICQGILIPIPKVETIELETEILKEIVSDRKEERCGASN